MTDETDRKVVFSGATAHSVTFQSADGKPAIKLNADGTIEFGEGITGDRAAELFVDTVRALWAQGLKEQNRALEACAEQFKSYADHHWSKVPPDVDKSRRNHDWYVHVLAVLRGGTWVAPS